MPNIPYNPMAEPGTTAQPVIFAAPTELTNGRHEVWIAVGGGEGWGGAEVWASVSGDTYDKVGQIGRGVVGTLVAPLAGGRDPDTINKMIVSVGASGGEIHPGTRTDADKFVTLCRVGDELLSYTEARLKAPHVYECGQYLRRGLFGTRALAHPAGTPFARLNQAVLRHEYPAHLAGTTVWFKFPAANEFGNQQQGLDEVEAHEFVLPAEPTPANVSTS